MEKIKLPTCCNYRACVEHTHYTMERVRLARSSRVSQSTRLPHSADTRLNWTVAKKWLMHAWAGDFSTRNKKIISTERISRLSDPITVSRKMSIQKNLTANNMINNNKKSELDPNSNGFLVPKMLNTLQLCVCVWWPRINRWNPKWSDNVTKRRM